MIRLLKLHRKYLFNKINVIIISIVIFLFILIAFVVISPFTNSEKAWMMREVFASNYEEVYLMFTKVITVLLSCYLFTTYFSKHFDEYKYLLLTKVTKNKYYITKSITLMLMLTLIMGILMLTYLLIGSLLTDWFVVEGIIIFKFLNILLIDMVYGLLSLIIVLIFKNIYTIVLSFSIYFLSEILLDYNKSNNIVKLGTLFFPNIDFNSNYVLTFNENYFVISFVSLIILIIMYYLISYFIYNYNE